MTSKMQILSNKVPQLFINKLARPHKIKRASEENLAKVDLYKNMIKRKEVSILRKKINLLENDRNSIIKQGFLKFRSSSESLELQTFYFTIKDGFMWQYLTDDIVIWKLIR
jgi:hypothetical protein